MAASVGTLKAYLTMDSAGFLGGFAKAGNATQAFNSKVAATAPKIATVGLSMARIGGGLGTLATGFGPAGIALAGFGAASILATRGVNGLLKTAAGIEKRFKLADAEGDIIAVERAVSRLGLGLSMVDASNVHEALLELRKLEGAAVGVAEKFVASVAPAVTHTAAAAFNSLEEISRGLGSLGYSWELVADSAVAAGAATVTTLQIVRGNVIALYEATSTLAETYKLIDNASSLHLAAASKNFAAISKNIGDIGVAGKILHEAYSGKAASDFINATVAHEPKNFATTALSKAVTGNSKAESPHAGAFERGSVEAAQLIQNTAQRGDTEIASFRAEAVRLLEKIARQGDPMAAEASGRALNLVAIDF